MGIPLLRRKKCLVLLSLQAHSRYIFGGLYISPLLNVVIILVTAFILLWYTWETYQLQKTAQSESKNIEKQIEVSQQQVRATQEQIEVSQRPFVVIDATWEERFINHLKIRNIGNSSAVNITVIIGSDRVHIPLLESREAIFAVVTINNFSICSELIARHNARIAAMKKEISSMDFPVEKSFTEDGGGLKIEYYNVAMMQYYTTQFIRPEEVIIESSGRVMSISTLQL